MYLKDVLDFFADEANYIESISFDNSDDDFKVMISSKYEDELDTAEIYLFCDGTTGVTNITARDLDDYDERSIISGEFIELIANFVDKWRSLKVD